MFYKIKPVYKQVKTVACLVMAAMLLAGCNLPNRNGKREEKPLALTMPDGTAVKAQNNSETAGGTSESGTFPDISSNPGVIDNKYGVYYEIFIRSFADSDGDGIGDFRGLTSRLDYLNDGNRSTSTDLGVNGIWLMPVNISPSYHKYDVVDYYNIDPEYGTIDDFKTFLNEAHKRGIKVIMDLVINHTSSQNPWFKDSARSADNPFRNYYIWAEEGQKGYNFNAKTSWGSRVWHSMGNSYFYAIFWDQMPDLNYDNPKVREEVKNIAKFWLEKGIDGFRLDAAMHIYSAFENHAGTNCNDKNVQWWKEFRAAAEETNPGAYLVGEVWEKSTVVAPYYKGLDSLFNFDASEGIISTVNSETDMAVGGKGFSSWLEEKYKSFARVEPYFVDAPFLSNHDQNRVMDRMGGDMDKAKLAADIYLTLPGNPFIYYGEEIGMRGSKPDERIREPFVWFSGSGLPQTFWEPISSNKKTVPVEVQQKDPASLLNYYKRLIRLRQSSNALMKGDFKALNTGNKRVVAYGRNYTEDGKVKESVVVLHNLSSDTQSITLTDIDLSKYEIFFESKEKGKNRIDDQEIGIQPKATVILRNVQA